MRSKASVIADLHGLCVEPGDLLMLHASLKTLGPVEGGAAGLIAALLEVVGPTGTLMGYASWDRSPYEATLNSARMSDDERRAWPAFDPETARTYRGFGLLNQFLADTPGARRSAHPDASMVAVGARAQELTEDHPLGHALGCLFPGFDGAILSQEWKEAHGPGSSRERHDHARRQSSNTAIASFARAVEPALLHKSREGFMS